MYMMIIYMNISNIIGGICLRKRDFIFPVLIVLIISFKFINDYSIKSIDQIIGRNMSIVDGNTLTLIYRNSFVHDGGVPVTSNDVNEINTLVDHLKKYRFRLTPNKEEDIKSYSIIISSDASRASSYKTAGDILGMYTLGDKYIRIKNKEENFRTYEVMGEPLDNAFFDGFYKSLH